MEVGPQLCIGIKGYTYLVGIQELSNQTSDTLTKRETILVMGNLVNHPGFVKSWTLEKNIKLLFTKQVQFLKTF